MAEQLNAGIRNFRLKIKDLSNAILRNDASRRGFRVLVQNLGELRNFANGTYESCDADLFDYEQIAKPKFAIHNEVYYDNTFFGCERAIRSYIGRREPIMGCFEHGIFWGVSGYEKEYKSSLPGIITFGQKRVERLAEVTSKRAFAIGPYIHYAGMYHEDELEDTKEKLGKTLLVFPAHSIQFIKSEYDSDELVNAIEEHVQQYNFETVIASFHPIDIEQGKHIPIFERGWKIFTAGNRYDYRFLQRLKSVLWLADAVFTNSAGTHVGYSIYMRKPVYFFDKRIIHTGVTDNDIKRSSSIGNKRAEQDTSQLKRLFAKPGYEITDEQYAFCDRYFGYSSVKTRDEICEIVQWLDAKADGR